MLKLWLLISKFQRFILKSSADMNVSPSLQKFHHNHVKLLYQLICYITYSAHITLLVIKTLILEITKTFTVLQLATLKGDGV